MDRLARYRSFRYLVYAAAFVLWAVAACWHSLLTCWDAWTGGMAYEWRCFCSKVRDVEDSHRPADSDSGWLCRSASTDARATCDKAPEGWACLGKPGHDGPCAATPVRVARMRNCPHLETCMNTVCQGKCGPR